MGLRNFVTATWKVSIMGNRKDNKKTNVKWPSALLIGIRQAAKLLGISERKLWERKNCGEIPCVRIGKRVLFSPDQLREWVASRKEGGR